MQLPFRIFTLRLAATTCLVALIGCRPPRPVEVPRSRPFAGVTVRVACGDPSYAKELTQRGAIWGANTGGKVVVEPDATNADAAVIPAVRIGEFAAADKLARLPERLTEREHQLQWAEVLPNVQDKLCSWGRRTVALPVAADGYVLLFRADRFAEKAAQDAHRAKFDRELTPPRTWEELREVADLFAAVSGKPSLPPLPADPTAAVAAFNRVAACYDRTAVRSEKAAGNPADAANAPRTAFRFHVDPEADAAPRFTSPSFVATLRWFHDTAKYRAAGDPLDALVNGTAVAGVYSLADVAKLPRGPSGAVSDKFGVGVVPGSAVWFDSAGKPQPAVGGRNYVPAMGGGQIAVVFRTAAQPDAAWDFLADLAGPSGADDTLGELSLGAGPFRYSHVTASEKAEKWQRYGFDAARTDQLAKAMAAFVEVQFREAVYPLRTPDQDKRVKLIDAVLRKAAAGQLAGEPAARELQAAWLAEDAKTPPADRVKWARNAAGLE